MESCRIPRPLNDGYCKIKLIEVMHYMCYCGLLICSRYADGEAEKMRKRNLGKRLDSVISHIQMTRSIECGILWYIKLQTKGQLLKW